MSSLCKIIFSKGPGVIAERSCEYTNKIHIGINEVPANTDSIEFFLDDFTAATGDKGFYIVPNPHQDTNRNTAQTFFRERPDCESFFPNSNMPIFAISHKSKAILAVVTGMPLDYSLVVGVLEGNYYIRPRFILDGRSPFEAIEIHFLELDEGNADYSGIAKRYRRFQLERNTCVPIRERMKKYPIIGESAQGPMVRLRMAWKPVPPPVLEQTEENEPPIHVAITFKRAEEIIDEFHRQGIKHAEFNLVGWNKSGHDGRFPDIFPVEELLGGEEGLIRLINKAKSYGYLISAHTNVLDAYTIAKRWEKDDMLLDNNAELIKGGQWGGGQSYFVCPKAAHEHYTVPDMDDMVRLGFRGTHYFDVMTILPPKICDNPLHPLNRRESGQWRGKSMALSREKVGASSSEGSYDFCIGDVDYVLYTIFNRTEPLPEICDKYIPFWHIVYHGIVLYNTFTDSVNAMLKADKTLALNNYEYGGRPLVYFYSKFRSSGSNWMGDDDLTCETDEQLREGVAAIKADYDKYRTIVDLQFEFLEEHKEITEKISAVTYSDGSVIVVNRSEDSFEYQGKAIAPYSFAKLKS
jgi:uncharacterized protein DUF5696